MSNITKYLELNKEKHIISEMTAFFWLIGDKEFCRNKINILIKSLITLVILLLLIFSGISNFISENKSLVVLIATLFTSAQFYFALSCLALSNSAKVAMTTVLSIVFSIFIAHLAYLDTIDRNIEIIAYITMFTTVFFAWITLAYTAESLKIFFKTFKTNEKLYEESKISYKNFVKRNEIELNTKEKESLKAFFEEDNFSTSAINVIKEKPLYLVERQAKLQENMDI